MHSLLEEHTERELSGSHGDRESTEIRVAVFWSLFGIWLQLHATKMGKEEWGAQQALSGPRGEGDSNSPGCAGSLRPPELTKTAGTGRGGGLGRGHEAAHRATRKASTVPAGGGEPMSKGQWLLRCFRNGKGQTRSPAEDTGGGGPRGQMSTWIEPFRRALWDACLSSIHEMPVRTWKAWDSD